MFIDIMYEQYEIKTINVTYCEAVLVVTHDVSDTFYY